MRRGKGRKRRRQEEREEGGEDGGGIGETESKRRESQEEAAGREKWAQNHGFLGPQGEQSASWELISVKFPN